MGKKADGSECTHKGKKSPAVHNRSDGPNIYQVVETKCNDCQDTTSVRTKIFKGGNN